MLKSLVVLTLCGSLVGTTSATAAAQAPVTGDGTTVGVLGSRPDTVAESEQPNVGAQFLSNPGFSRGAQGWRAEGHLDIASVGQQGGPAAVLTSTEPQWVGLTKVSTEAVPSSVGSALVARAWVRTTQLGQHGALVVREVRAGKATALHRAHFTLQDGGWHLVKLIVRPEYRDTSLIVRVRADQQQPGSAFTVDHVTLRVGRTAAAERCGFSRRGIPTAPCGPLVGAAFKSNTDPSHWESELGRPLGVRRTYWAAHQIRSAVKVAEADVRAHRIPWVSFKLPYKWTQMAAGKGDQWARDLATRLSQVNGPVWLALHHEPEGDGPVAAWKAMQERLAPIVRSIAPNVAYTVILMGWHQVAENSEYGLNQIWPDTEIDIAGFDPYNWYGTVRGKGRVDRHMTDMKKTYFDPISRWAQSRGIEWAVAETGYTDAAHEVDPNWLPNTLRGLREDNGIALTYFNSPLNSAASWTWVLDTPGKTAAFARTLTGTALLR